MKTRMSEKQISRLRDSYSTLKSLPVSKIKRLESLFEGRGKEVLEQLKAANINFVSSIAATRLLQMTRVA